MICALSWRLGNTPIASAYSAAEGGSQVPPHTVRSAPDSAYARIAAVLHASGGSRALVIGEWHPRLVPGGYIGGYDTHRG